MKANIYVKNLNMLGKYYIYYFLHGISIFLHCDTTDITCKYLPFIYLYLNFDPNENKCFEGGCGVCTLKKV